MHPTLPSARRRSRWILLGIALLASADCTSPPTDPADDETPIEDLAPSGLHWIAPLAEDQIAVGEPLELAVFTLNAGAHAVHFAIDGVELGVCEPSEPDEDCHEDNNWFWTATFSSTGSHTVAASFTDADGHAVTTTRTINVLAAVAELPDPPDQIAEAEPMEPDADVEEGEPDPPADHSQPEVLEGDSTISQAVTVHYDVSRGYLDPSHDFRSFRGGISYRVSRQQVLLQTGHINGSTSQVCGCLRRNWASFMRYTGHDTSHGGSRVSRGSLVAALSAGDSCDHDPGSLATRAFMRGRHCASIAHAAHLDIAASGTMSVEQVCRSRLQTAPDFAISLMATYLSLPSVVRRHMHDPPRIAALISTGGVRVSRQNHWHMLSRGDFIDHFVAAYNSYRTQESGGEPDYPSTYNFMNGRYNHPLRSDGGNRVVNPGASGTGAETQLWEVRGDVPVRNGFGEERGRLGFSCDAPGSGECPAHNRVSHVKINYGMRRALHIGGVAVDHVYAFSVSILPTDGFTPMRRASCGGPLVPVGSYNGSGWIPEDSVVAHATLRNVMPTVHPTPAGTGPRFLVTGAPPEQDYVDSSHYPGVMCEPSRGFNDRKVRKVYTGGGVKASDYYLHDDNVVNLGFALAGNGGVSDDTVPVATAARPVFFVEASDVPHVHMPLYEPCSATESGQQNYIYGHVETPDGDRWGWIEYSNLTLAR